MAVSAKTVQRWKRELETNERLLNTQSIRFSWLRRLYVQLYQFLLSRYADEGLPAPPPEDDGDEGEQASQMPFRDFTLDHRGLQARSPQSLRDALEKIHSNQPTPTKPSDPQRSATPEWVVVATSQDSRLSSCERVLRIQGIMFHKSAVGFYESLEVPFEDRNAAFAALTAVPRKSLRWSKHDKDVAKLWRDTKLLLLLVAIPIVALTLFWVIFGSRISSKLK